MAFDLYPAVDENLNFAQPVRIALAKSLELRNTVVPMTTVVRNNLTGEDLWDGRVIVNLTTGNIERYDLASSTWKASVDADWVDANTSTVYYGVGGPPAGTDFKSGDIYCQYL